jgi:phosphohistidine phosphatase SixA
MKSSTVRSIRFFSAAALLAITGCASSQSIDEGAPVVPTDRGETTVYLVRHAERSTNDPVDPDLSDAGFIRADSLANQLREAGVNVVIVTNRKRTLETALPLARRRHVTPEVVPLLGSTAEHVDSMVAAIRRHEGATILVVGHSNTIGRIADKLGGDAKIGDLCDNEYSDLIIVEMPKGKKTRMLVDSYGPPNPPGDGTCKMLMDRQE